MKGNRGFSSIEPLIVMATVGILASIAVPSFRVSVAEDDAAAIRADVAAVRLAAHQFLQGNSRFPALAANGAVPAELAGQVPAFEYEGVTYQWLAADFRELTPFYGGTALGVFIVYFNGRSEVAEQFRDRPVGWAAPGLPDYAWAPQYAIFLMLE